MANRNDKLGGTDFVNGEVLFHSDLNDTNTALIDLAANGVAQNAYQTLKHAGTFDNKDNLGADRFTDEDGINNTVNVENSITTYYDSTNNNYELTVKDEANGDTTYDPNSFSNPENAFDGDDSTYARKSSNNGINVSLGKTFSSATYDKAFIKCSAKAEEPNSVKNVSGELESFDGSNWNLVQTLFSQSSTAFKTNGSFVGFVDISTETNIQGLRVRLYASNSDDGQEVKLHTLEYGNIEYATLFCNQNLPTLTGNEKSICVYVEEVNTANTNITYNVSDGTNTVSDLEFNTVNGIESLGSGQLEITFNLETTDSSETPELYGYSYYIN